MSDRLERHVFSKDEWANIQGFSCGEEPYELEVANWLKGSDDPNVDSALNSIKHPVKPSRVWLYKLDDIVVGFGSLAKTTWRWPGKNKDPKLPLSIIIWVGVPAKQ